MFSVENQWPYLFLNESEQDVGLDFYSELFIALLTALFILSFIFYLNGNNDMQNEDVQDSDKSFPRKFEKINQEPASPSFQTGPCPVPDDAAVDLLFLTGRGQCNIELQHCDLAFMKGQQRYILQSNVQRTIVCRRWRRAIWVILTVRMLLPLRLRRAMKSQALPGALGEEQENLENASDNCPEIPLSNSEEKSCIQPILKQRLVGKVSKNASKVLRSSIPVAVTKCKTGVKHNQKKPVACEYQPSFSHEGTARVQENNQSKISYCGSVSSVVRETEAIVIPAGNLQRAEEQILSTLKGTVSLQGNEMKKKSRVKVQIKVYLENYLSGPVARMQGSCEQPSLSVQQIFEKSSITETGISKIRLPVINRKPLSLLDKNVNRMRWDNPLKELPTVQSHHCAHVLRNPSVQADQEVKVETFPFRETGKKLQFHIARKKLQHLFGLPQRVQKSVNDFMLSISKRKPKRIPKRTLWKSL